MNNSTGHEVSYFDSRILTALHLMMQRPCWISRDITKNECCIMKQLHLIGYKKFSNLNIMVYWPKTVCIITRGHISQNQHNSKLMDIQSKMDINFTCTSKRCLRTKAYQTVCFMLTFILTFVNFLCHSWRIAFAFSSVHLTSLTLMLFFQASYMSFSPLSWMIVCKASALRSNMEEQTMTDTCQDCYY